jgi:hypothetical protein
MMKVASFLCVLALGTLVPRATAQSIATLFGHNNWGSIDGANYFDAEVKHPNGLKILAMQVNCGPLSTLGAGFGVDVYTIPGTFHGNETNFGAWTLVATGTGVVAPPDTPVPINISDFILVPGSYGIAIVFTGETADLAYTDGTGTNQNYGNADIALTLGSASNVPFAAPILAPRVWNGSIHYNVVGGCPDVPAVYCTAKVNSAGCTPSIGSTGTPSASAGSGFVVTTINELNDKFGLYFYSKSGPTNVAFQGGLLCAAPPLVRTKLQNSGGAPPCGGTYTMDFNAYIASGVDPALVAGQQVWLQTWSRDPASPSTTNLSDALTFTICP